MKIAQVGEAILRATAKLVADSEIHSDEFQTFVDELLLIMQEAYGVGIAAPQVFDERAVMIIASRPSPRYPDAPDMAPLVLINPKVIQSASETVKDWEGCLSVPGLRGFIRRATWVDVEYQSRDGGTQKRRLDGFVARIFLHEYDHLIGKTWLDHVEVNTDIMAESVWRRDVAGIPEEAE
ncbi:peptide deformylase [Paraglaciecola sp. L1A13]|uniref:peptide deformylase n=1 Tax=Paraglaciecola sp. L1A13 TaxID=2686359 RepID=UPI00131DAF9D|nr:peptide deformylase [Paraglaciecola sp. L1A13]|tara:strand:- start:84 stop:623 length:540 start_codon:yes stop_codon:yes gene_type:complete